MALYLHSFFPGQPQVSAGEETRDRVSRDTMDPSFFSQLDHDRVDPRVTGFALKSIGYQIFRHNSRVLFRKDSQNHRGHTYFCAPYERCCIYGFILKYRSVGAVRNGRLIFFFFRSNRSQPAKAPTTCLRRF